MALQVAGVSWPDLLHTHSSSLLITHTWVASALITGVLLWYYEREAHRAEIQRRRFLEGVSSELRRPLGVIEAINALLLDERRSAPTEALLDLELDHISDLVRRVDELLDLDPTTVHHLAPPQGDFALVDQLRAVGAVLGVRCRERGVGFNLQLGPTLPERVTGDGQALRSAITTLGQLALSVAVPATITLRADRVGGAVRLLLRCAAGGAPLPGPTAATQALVRSMGGDLTWGPCTDCGDGYEVEVPLGSVVEGLDADLRPRPTDSLRVLVVEDLDVARELLASLLISFGHEVFTATQGREALDLWQQHRPDLVLMDVQMPIMDGITATRILRSLEQEHGWPRTPVVAATGHSTPRDRRGCASAGMDEMLVKPVEIDKLRDVLERVGSGAFAAGEA